MKGFLSGLVILGLLFGVAGQARSQFIYWSDALNPGHIWRANLDGSGQQTLLSGLPLPGGIALDVAGGQMYWADTDSGDIRRANLDGTGQETLLSGPGPILIALDVPGGKMYWTDDGSGDIRRANIDGSGQETLVVGLASPRSIALDLPGGKMYWAVRDTGDIRRANLDGSGLEILVRNLSTPTGMALDLPSGKMYWAETGAGKIQRANLDGSGQEILVRNPSAHGIALDLAGGKMYWTNLFGNGDIRRANLDGTREEILIKGLSLPGFMALDLGAPGTAAYFTVAAPASASAGTPFDITVTALDPYGNTAVNYQGTVTFSTSDTDPGIVLPADYTFTAADAGVHTFSGAVTLITPGEQTVTATDTASGMTRSTTVTVAP
jgi:DNA-binding beta-propeller fold protein YncE